MVGIRRRGNLKQEQKPGEGRETKEKGRSRGLLRDCWVLSVSPGGMTCGALPVSYQPFQASSCLDSCCNTISAISTTLPWGVIKRKQLSFILRKDAGAGKENSPCPSQTLCQSTPLILPLPPNGLLPHSRNFPLRHLYRRRPPTPSLS